MRVLVCGGRDFHDRAAAFDALDRIDAETMIETVIHGQARGADSLADEWASDRVRWVQPFPADWQTFGRSAGPIRNRLMLVNGKPDLVVAFPGGRGTADMVRQARRAGIRVIEPLTPSPERRTP